MAASSDPMPPVPSQSSISDTGAKSYFGLAWTQWFVQAKAKIDVINLSIAGLAKVSGTGLTVHTDGGWVTRQLKGTTGRISVANGDGVSADPTADLVPTAVTAGTYNNANITVDQWGRITAATNGSSSGAPLTTKGDLFTYDTADARLPVGTDGQVLAADSSQPTGLKWQSAGTPTLPITTKGDILGYSTVPARIPVGTDGQVLIADSTNANGVDWGSVKLPTGTSFPASPSDGDIFFRSDLGILCFRNNSLGQWLSVQEYDIGGSMASPTSGVTNNNDFVGQAPVRTDYSIYITKWCCTSRVLSNNNGSNFWTTIFAYQDSSNTATTIGSFSTASDANNTPVPITTSINVVLNAAAKRLIIYGVKTGTPGALLSMSAIYYRLIVT